MFVQSPLCFISVLVLLSLFGWFFTHCSSSCSPLRYWLLFSFCVLSTLLSCEIKWLRTTDLRSFLYHWSFRCSSWALITTLIFFLRFWSSCLLPFQAVRCSAYFVLVQSSTHCLHDFVHRLKQTNCKLSLHCRFVLDITFEFSYIWKKGPVIIAVFRWKGKQSASMHWHLLLRFVSPLSAFLRLNYRTSESSVASDPNQTGRKKSQGAI